MERQPVRSSMIASVGYDLEDETLEIEFVANGEVYQYFNVPYETYHDLMEAHSKGNYLKENIMEEYNYSKVEKKKRRFS